MNELSPRRFPRGPVVPPKTPPQWKKPQDVMRERKIRLKQNALLARINRSPSHDNVVSVFSTTTRKRKNPFSKCKEAIESDIKKVKPETEIPTESSLLEILGITESKEVELSLNTHSLSCINDSSENKDNEISGISSLKTLPVDWTLRTKMRFISPKPFPWTQMLKTCEEASGITGFVRCLESSNERSGAGLDNSPNSRFHQNCLFWQHPHLPWLELYPRHNLRKADKSPFPLIPAVKDALYKDWSNSFRSLFQLVRARHCPYFYIIANTFTCLFRAAGINGIEETTAYVCPTTRGFQKLLREEGINFSMPLRDDNKKRRSNGVSENEEEEEEIEEGGQEEDEKEETEDWLASLGIAESEISKIKTAEDASLLKLEDKSDDSLVLVDGCEVHALFNFLINCKSAIATTGPLTGIPPTLISPVAFTGGTLLPLKVRESTVKQDNERFYTVEVRGPILPNTVHNLCNMLQEDLETFSVTFANIDFTKGYTLCKGLKEAVANSPTKQTHAFSIESLADSGLDTNSLSVFCSDNLQAFDSLRKKVGISASCEEMLISFATLSANFTFCTIRNARPIKLCQDCVSTYMNVKSVYNSILHIEDMGGDSCRDKLINLDRLQVVDSGFDYTNKLWSRAFCDTCFNFYDKEPPKLKPAVLQILNISEELSNCIFKNPNDTCKKCENQYFVLNDIYNNMRADTGQSNFCMDIVDLMNTTRGNWSGVYGCCNDRKKPEIIFLSLSGGVFIASLLFYGMIYTFTRKSEHPIIPQKRWKQKFSRRASVSSTVNS